MTRDGQKSTGTGKVIFVDFASRRRVEEDDLDAAWERARVAPAAAAEPAADVFSMAEVARLTGLSLARLRKLDQAGVVSPSSRVSGRRSYTFRDLVVLRMVQGLLARKVKVADVAEAVQALRGKLPKAIRSLTELRIVSDGRRVVVRAADGSFEPLTGQMLLDFEVKQLRDDVVRVLRPRSEQERRRVAFDLYRRGCELDENPETMDEAAALYKRAVDLDPMLSIAYTNLGNLHFRRGDEDTAVELYHRALDIDPSQPEALYNLGFLLLDRGQPVAALPFLEGVVESNPRFPDAHFYLAMAYESVGQHEDARTFWLSYLAIEPEGAWADVARRHL